LKSNNTEVLISGSGDARVVSLESLKAKLQDLEVSCIQGTRVDKALKSLALEVFAINKAFIDTYKKDV
jgi:hypothetical protein